jgi:hypothetical protein
LDPETADATVDPVFPSTSVETKLDDNDAPLPTAFEAVKNRAISRPSAMIVPTIGRNDDFGADDWGTTIMGRAGPDADAPIFMFTKERYSSSNGKTNPESTTTVCLNVL